MNKRPLQRATDHPPPPTRVLPQAFSAALVLWVAAISCQPTRAEPVTTCTTAAHCPAGNAFYCDQDAGVCKPCPGGDCSSTADAGASDGSGTDSASGDAAVADAGDASLGADSAVADSAVADSAVADSAVVDSAVADSAVADASTADTLTPDAGTPADVAPTDVAAADAGAACKHPAQCVGAAMPTWQLKDIQPTSAKYNTTYGLSGFIGKVTVLALLSGW